MSDSTQWGEILAYCEEHGSITVREATVYLEINSPRKCISEMRNSGLYDVLDVWETRTNRSDKTVRYKRYFIKAVAANG